MYNYETDKKIRGEDIKATHWHDSGAIGRCSYCGRYSENTDCMDSAFICDCGKKSGYSGSFKSPNNKSIWSDY